MSGAKRIYPPNWKEISKRVRERSGGRCECQGECGLHRPRCGVHHVPVDVRPAIIAHPRLGHEILWRSFCVLCPGEAEWDFDSRCRERNGHAATWAKGKVVLTVAHLCQRSECADEAHMRAMCNRCHLRYDQPQHQANAPKTRRAKKGQELFPEGAA